MLSFNRGDASREYRRLPQFPKQCLLCNCNSPLLHPVKTCIYLFQLHLSLTQRAKSEFPLNSCISSHIVAVCGKLRSSRVAAQHGSDVDRRFLHFSCNLALMRLRYYQLLQFQIFKSKKIMQLNILSADNQFRSGD